jgi:3-ketosteroid 9alpha-monooxygenase subunit B
VTQRSDERHSFHPLRVREVVRETEDACSLVFDVPDDAAVYFAYRAGQFLTFEFNFDGKPLRRCYSLASAPETCPALKVTVKRVLDGRISNWINDAVRQGDVLYARPPEGRFVMTDSAEHSVLFAAGSGITPVISIIKSALASSARQLTLVYANRNERSIIFREELAALAARSGARLRVVHRLDNIDGFLRVADIPTLLGARRDGEYFVCGPDGFMSTVERGLATFGVQPSQIHVERFVSPPDTVITPEQPADEQIPERVAIELQGKTYDVPYVRGKTLLQSALAAGLDAPYSCEEGFCGSCVARLYEGEVSMLEDEALTADEKRKGYVLTCQAYPTTRSCSIKYLDL